MASNTSPDITSTEKNHGRIAPVPDATIPYWRTQPHHLDEYRSTSDLPSKCDIAIIGCGMSGVCTAYHLIRQNKNNTKLSITLLDARQVCSGATGRNGGHVKMKTSTSLTYKTRFGIEFVQELATFVRALMYELKDVVESEQLDCEFELRRTLDVFLNEQEAQETGSGFCSSLADREAWTKDVDFIAKQFAEQVTSIKEAKAGFSSPACSFWPYKFVTQLLERIIGDVNLQTNTLVTGVDVDANSDTQTVRTTRGDIKATKVVFASNAYTGGVSPTYLDKIVPYKGTASHLVPTQPVSPHLSHTYNIAYGPHVDYLNPRPDGSIVVGGAATKFREDRKLWFNNWDDSQLLPDVDNYFDTLMQRNFKGWSESGSKLNHLWTGIMGITADGLPHVGEVPGYEGKQYVIAGFNGGGMSLIFSCARGLAGIINESVAFSETGIPGRFQTSAERLERPVEGIDTIRRT